MTFIGYCTRCKEKRTVVDGVVAKTKTGKDMQRGHCSVCGAGVVRMGAPKPE